MLHKLDPKYDVPGRTRLKRLIDQTYESSKSQVLGALSSARFVCGELSAGKRNQLCQHGTACVHEAEQTTTVQTKLLRT